MSLLAPSADSDHFILFNDEDGGRRDCGGRRTGDFLPCQTHFAEEVPSS
jgi:hypothetical protein